MERETAENGIVFFRSPLLCGVRHGFSTRIGGVGREPAYTAQTNLAFDRGDSPGVVMANLAAFAGALDIDPRTVVSLPQIHSSLVSVVTHEMCGEGYYYPPHESCDGYVTADRNTALGIKTADCVPLLLYEPKARIIGALHAGHRGTTSGIALSGMARMKELGADPAFVRVAIGASIRQCCYEVGCDILNAARELIGNAAGSFFLPRGRVSGSSSTGSEKYMADLAGMNAFLLESTGVLPENIDISADCTCCRSDMYFSHRASHGQRGTMLALISM